MRRSTRGGDGRGRRRGTLKRLHCLLLLILLILLLLRGRRNNGGRQLGRGGGRAGPARRASANLRRLRRRGWE